MHRVFGLSRAWWRWDKATREAHNVYTLDDDMCVASMIDKILSE